MKRLVRSKQLIKFLLPLLALGVCGTIGWFLISTAPKAERRAPKPTVAVVEVVKAAPSSYPILVKSQGTVSPRTQSTLVAEVSGQVIEVVDALRNGGFFEQGQTLLRIDPRDYETAVTIARAELVQARLTLAEEEARSLQAQQDWQRLELSGEPDALVLRKPQLANAEAAVAAAQARLAQAQINLERTEIKAPYAGRVLEKNVDIAEYVTPGSALASIYAVDYVEIRLPISNRQLELIDLPETYRNAADETPIPVSIQGQVGTRNYTWQGQIVRVEGAIDTASRQWFVVAQVDDPYARRLGNPPLKVGQFVTAEIEGRTLEDVYRLPRSVLRPGDQILVVSGAREISRREVAVLWETGEEVVVLGLDPLEEIVVSGGALIPEGTRVQVSGEQSAKDVQAPVAESHSASDPQE